MVELAATKTQNVFCVEIPPYGKSKEQVEGFRYAKLDSKRKWFVDTPVILKTNNLIVEKIIDRFN
jgi:hypothetical protein